MNETVPQKAMVLAAGLGLRMRPLTETVPKPLVPVAGKPLIDWALDALQRVGVAKAVVNVHHLPELMVAHLARRTVPRVTICEERETLLDSGGGIANALPHLGAAPFFVLNADTFWIDGARPNLARLALTWDAAHMDILILLADPAIATGHTGKVDFTMDKEGRLKRAGDGEGGFIYAGAAIVEPRLFEAAPEGPYSINVQFDRAIAAGRLFGLPLDGHWITVGTPEAIAPAEAVLRRFGAAL